jgi:hypothetical protein
LIVGTFKEKRAKEQKSKRAKEQKKENIAKTATAMQILKKYFCCTNFIQVRRKKKQTKTKYWNSQRKQVTKFLKL